jgi:hypothetical protein
VVTRPGTLVLPNLRGKFPDSDRVVSGCGTQTFFKWCTQGSGWEWGQSGQTFYIRP